MHTIPGIFATQIQKQKLLQAFHGLKFKNGIPTAYPSTAPLNGLMLPWDWCKHIKNNQGVKQMQLR